MADNDRDNVKEDRRVRADAPRADARADADAARRDKERADKEKAAREEAEKSADEGRKAVFERERLALEQKQELEEARIKQEREKREEELRLANLTPEQRAGEISQFVHTVPHSPTMTDAHRPTEFVLSEANGHRSRGNCYLADPVSVVVGMPMKKTAEATATQPPTYVLAAAGADCLALALYSGGSIPGEGLRISAIVRDAEVNGLCITWPGAFDDAAKAAGITALATQGIIVRL